MKINSPTVNVCAAKQWHRPPIRRVDHFLARSVFDTFARFVRKRLLHQKLQKDTIPITTLPMATMTTFLRVNFTNNFN